MPIELKVPSVGESITKVVIGAWKKKEGDAAQRDESLVEIETDKATIELPAPVAGSITRILKREGDAAAVGEVIGFMEEGAAPAATARSAVAAPMAARSAAPAGGAVTAEPLVASSPGPARASGGSPPVMPAARRAAAQAGVSIEQVAGTGPGGRVLKEDVQRQAASGGGGGSSFVAHGASEAAGGSESGGANGHAAAAARQEQAVPMTPLRQRVAARLVESQQTAALLTTFNEVDMHAAMALRNQYKDAFEKKYGVKLGFMSLFVKAAIDALKLYPQLNAEIRDMPGRDGQSVPHVVYRNYYDIGVAVSGGKGLVVPVVRSAERMSFAEIERQIADFGARGRENKLKLEELQGGTFTISNGGVFGSLMSTPIINPPQSGILGLHAIQDRPVACDGQVVIRPMMYLALTYDHRIVDGREAVTFLRRIKECVEDPTRVLIEV
ncbi:MAG: 2-oxoglutarate dehydrogenase complex dihydrolipoyllysine-residue succinyltransferase [Phycisphaerales bacterium]|nr:2-oxoglutarate dehydrogenase complex dihydrolipoyllysine-residue succinyltransferase [Phycisphaerales bacterium]